MHSRHRQQLVDWSVAGLVGAVLLLLSNLLVPPPAFPPEGHPARFAEIAADPFAFTGMFPQRILWPLLAHVAGWFGLGPVGFSQVCLGGLLAVVFWFARRRGAGPLDAGLVAALVAASGAVGVYKPMACMSDPLNLLLLVLTVHCVARPFWFWGLVLLASLSHEMVFFFSPWLLWLRRAAGGTWAGAGGALAATLAVYAAWRFLVRALTPVGAPVVAYDAAYYIENNFWVPWGLPTMWALWALVAAAEFGPLLVLAALAAGRGERVLGGRVGIALFTACVLALMLLAYDVFRFATFLFLPVVCGALAGLGLAHGRAILVVLLAGACGSYAWQHPIPSEQGGRAFTDVAGQVRELLILRMQAAGREVVPKFTAGDAWTFARDLFARTGPTFVVLAVVWAVCLAAGWWWSRRAAAGGPAQAG